MAFQGILICLEIEFDQVLFGRYQRNFLNMLYVFALAMHS